MNRIYRVIIDRRLGRACVASELARKTGSASGSTVRRSVPMLAVLAAALQWTGGQALAACTPDPPPDGGTVSCTGTATSQADPNNFYAYGNNLDITVQPGTLMSATNSSYSLIWEGTGLRLVNFGIIDAGAFGAQQASGIAIGFPGFPTGGAVSIRNEQTIRGTFGGSYGFEGMALQVTNQGSTTIVNNSLIETGGSAPDALVAAVYGGSEVNFTNNGTIIGRMAFESSNGDRFLNNGTINGSVSLGNGNDTFTAVSGSRLEASTPTAPAYSLFTPTTPSIELKFAATGTVDAGDGSDALVLQNSATSPGSGTGGPVSTISASRYLNFERLIVNSGTWVLNGAVVSDITSLNGGLAIFNNAGAFGTAISANGGAIEPSVDGLTLSPNISLAAGLTVQGDNSLTLSGTLTGNGGLVKNGGGTLTLAGNNNFSGGLVLNDGGLTLGSANSLGSGLFIVGGPASLNAPFTGTLNNPVQLGSALTVHSTGTLTLGGPIAGGGSLTLGSGNLALAGANNYTGGTVLNGGTIDVATSGALGSGALTVSGLGALTGAAGVVLGNDVVLDSTLRFAAGGSGGALTLDGRISGAGGISVAGAPGLTLNGANDFGGGLNLGGGVLTVGNDQALGTGSVTVSAISALAANTAVSLANDIRINADLGIGGANDLTLTGTLSGGGDIVKSGTGTLTLTGANTYFGGITVAGGTLQANNGTGSATGGGSVVVQSGGRLAGGGRVGGDVVVESGGVLAPGASAGAMGTLAVGGDMSLLAGSRLDFQFGTPGADFGTAGQSDSVSVAGNLSITPGATLDVADASGFGPGVYRLIDYAGTLAPGSTLALGSMPAGTTLSIQNLSADKRFMLVNTTGMTLNFWNANGLASPTQAGGGTGTWSNTEAAWTDAAGSATVPMQPQPGFAVFSGAAGTVTVDNTPGAVQATGMQFASSGYTLAGDALTLVGTGGGARAEVRVGDGGAGSAGYVATIGNAVAGSAGLVKTGAGTLVLGGTNGYTGGTAVQAGTLSVSADANLGAAGGGIALDGGRLQVTGTGFTGTTRGIDIGAAGGEIEVVDAGLNLAAGGALSGGGALRKSGEGTLTLAGASSYTGATTVAAGTLRMGAAAVLPSSARVTLADRAGAALDLNGFDQTIGSLAGGGSAGGELRLGSATLSTGGDDSSSTFGGTIGGAGGLLKQGSGNFTLTGASSHAGATQVAAGTLSAGAANVLSAKSAHGVSAGATLDLAGFSQTVGALANAGTVSLVGSAPGTTLTVRGAYTGSNGVLRLGTVLGAADPSDRLVLDGAGATASGRTTVRIANLGGLGALTSGDGIEVVSARNGATTTAQTTKDAFALDGGHVDAGAYEYRLYAADANGAGENWYLRSSLPGSPGGAAPLPTYRVEVPLHAALPQQLRQGNLAMLGSLALRGGADDDAGTPPAARNDAGGSSSNADGMDERRRRAWGRLISADIDIAQRGTVGARSDGRLHGFQAGTDLWADTRWRTGVYVGQLEGDIRVSGDARGLAGLAVGSNDLRSRYLGAYATWRGDQGWYADAVLQAGQHRYGARPVASFGSSGKGESLLASVEVGKAFELGGGWRVEPQLQLIHQRLDLDAASISGARIAQSPDDGLIVRAGVRVKGEIATAAGRLQPYGRFNVFHASGGADVAQFLSLAGSTAIRSETGATSTELAGGMTLAVGERTAVYAELGKLWASGGGARVKSALNASLGVRVRW
ncbi:fibronectin-binding autotransporter adhesin [Variovorax sp. TBS-050B]|uniref:autotransporter outer membrane beta-barrel domain-containing protein n=1 Tax=Variovorax sp. TBS-050B TaxID=2940551 RepID=UPI002473B093|nr:autotransporter outer membrane beta-barrel domain-containing protein [Variovorax sp. TBS-050B]MDH6593315.1 fibronectin-binding autotransporter adhesin [Variovorax sp. TBS-050B]